jgi:hypothetical protein
MVPGPDRARCSGPLLVEPPLTPRSAKVACVDFSAAKGGPLVARYDGENILSAEKFVRL